MELLILALMIYSNCSKASKKKLNVFSWGFFTLLAIFISQTIGAALVMILFYKGKIAAANVEQARAVADAILQNPLHGVFIVFCGIGGFLYIRYLLEKKEGVKPEA